MFTGSVIRADSVSNHKLQIELNKNVVHAAELTGNKARGKFYEKVIRSSSFVPALPSCITPTDIKQVSIIQNGNDAWFLVSGVIFAAKANNVLERLTLDYAIYR